MLLALLFHVYYDLIIVVYSMYMKQPRSQMAN